MSNHTLDQTIPNISAIQLEEVKTPVDLTILRQQYQRSSLLESDLAVDPFIQFKTWFEVALACQLSEPYAMTLATANKEGRPSARVVLLRQYHTGDFQFYTNYESQKGLDLAENPQAEILFYWAELQQQVRVYGKIEALSEEDSITYFHKRPLGTQIATHASTPQSGIIASRDALEAKFATLKAQYETANTVPKPARWGGYRLIPEQFEFWQGRLNRMHDRIRYSRVAKQEGNDWDNDWTIQRLMP